MARDLIAEKKQGVDLLAAKRQPVDLLAGRKSQKSEPKPDYWNNSQNMARQESRMASHPDLLKEGFNEVRSGAAAKSGRSSIGTGLKLLGGGIQRVTSAAINPMIAAQKDPWALVDPRKYGPEALKGITGEKRGDVGDLLTGAGARESSASVGGLALESALLAPEAIVNAPKIIANAPKAIRSLVSDFRKARVARNFGKMKPDLAKAKAISEELASGVEKARETVGKAQGDYIDANALALLDDAQFQALLKKLPPDLAEEIAGNNNISKALIGQIDEGAFTMGPASKQVRPQITRVRGKATDIVEPTYNEASGKYANEIVTPKKFVENPEDIVALHQVGEGAKPRQITSISPKESYSLRTAQGPGGRITKGKEVVSPTLKNAETIRRIIKGEVPSRHFKPNLLDEQTNNLIEGLYDEVGKLMREGRPDLAKKMQAYAETMKARAEILPQLKSKTGYTKARPILRMFGDDAEITSGQAVRRLAQDNPEIMGTVEKARSLGKSVGRKKYIRGVTRNIGRGAAIAGGFYF